MRAEDHQSQWFSFGVVLFGGGVVVSADWVFAVKSAPFDNHLSFTEWPIWLWIGMMAIGVYVMLASYIEKWPLPGKTRVRFARRQRSIALSYLAAFHLIGNTLSESNGNVTRDEIGVWIAHLGSYVQDAWGFAEQTVIISSTEWSGVPQNTSIGVNERLLGIIQRASILPVQTTFLTGANPGWKVYADVTTPGGPPQ
jgi:hypothetical protein